MPNRILKESICDSETINGLKKYSYEVMFYRLLTKCDDFGRFDARPKIIKSALFPLKDDLTIKEVCEGLQALANSGLVVLYEHEGRPFLYLPTWDRHQTIRAKRSKYPEPDCNLQASASICKQMQANVPVIQSNPIQSESESESESNARTRAEGVFDAFWSEYPKKVGKGAALKAFAKVKKEAYPLLVPAVQRQKQSAQWQKDGGQYIPNPATWLNQERWLDEGVSAPAGKPGYRAQQNNGELGRLEREAVERMMRDDE